MTDEWSEGQWDASDAAIRAAAHAILAEGPLAIDELTARLARDGVLAAFDGCESDELEEIVDEALVVTDETWHSNTGMICLVSELLRGAILTHRVTADELERGVLDAMPDLAAIGWGLGHGWTLPSGGEIVHAYRGKGEQRLADDGSFVGPAGWLDGIDSGELVAATCDGERFELLRGVIVDDATQAASVVRAAFDELCEPDSAMECDDLMLEALLRDGSVFRRPTEPVAELIERAGLRLREGWVGRADREFTTPGQKFHAARLERLAAEYQLDTCCREALERVIALWSDFVLAAAGHKDEVAATWNARRVRDDFHHGAVSPAFVDDLLGRNEDRLDLLDEFAAVLSLSRELEPVGLYLVAHNALSGGAAGEALESIRRSTTLDAEFGPALDLHATLLADAGLPADALSARGRAVAFDGSDHDLEYLSNLLEPYTRAGRNDPCPCGSGRKFKQCCQRDPKLSLFDRRSLSIRQAIWWINDPLHHSELFSLAMEAFQASGAPPSELQKRVRLLLGDPFLISLALFDDGGIDGYVRERGEIIPSTELEWLRASSDSRRSLWEYRRLQGDSFELRDVQTGEVRESVAIDDMTLDGQGYLFARIVDDAMDGTAGVLGPALKISLGRRDVLMALLDADGDSTDLAAWYGSLLAPSVLQNREGDPLVLSTAYFSPSSGIEWQSIEAALDEMFDRQGDSWFEYLDLDGEQIVRASMRRDGDELGVDINSVARFERVRDALVAVGLEFQRSESPDPSGAGDTYTSTPEVDIAEDDLDQIRDQMEDRWLKEHVPAFDGLTPRQAVDDPTRRDDVIKIIEGMEHRPAIGFAPYDLDRLRTKLGLPPRA